MGCCSFRNVVGSSWLTLTVLFVFAATEPPPFRHSSQTGYGPPAPVEFSNSNELSNEALRLGADLPNAFRMNSGFSPKNSPPKFSSLGAKGGGVSSSYINIVHGGSGGGGSGGGGGRLRPAVGTSVYSSQPVGASFSFDGSKTSASNGFSNSGEYFDPGFKVGYKLDGLGGGESVADSSGTVPSYIYSSASGHKPHYSLPPSFNVRGGDGSAYSTSNVNVGSGGGGSSGSSSFGSSRPSYQSGSRYSNPFSVSDGLYSSESNGYSSRALKGADDDDEMNSSNRNYLVGKFADGAKFQVQSSYSTG